MSELNPMTGKPWAGPKPRDPQPVENVVESRGGAEGEGDIAPGLNDDELEPPDSTEPLLASVNPKVGPETRADRTARYRALRIEAEKELALVPGSKWAEFVALEENRDRRMNEVRKAFLAAQKKKS